MLGGLPSTQSTIVTAPSAPASARARLTSLVDGPLRREGKYYPVPRSHKTSSHRLAVAFPAAAAAASHIGRHTTTATFSGLIKLSSSLSTNDVARGARHPHGTASAPLAHRVRPRRAESEFLVVVVTGHGGCKPCRGGGCELDAACHKSQVMAVSIHKRPRQRVVCAQPCRGGGLSVVPCRGFCSALFQLASAPARAWVGDPSHSLTLPVRVHTYM